MYVKRWRVGCTERDPVTPLFFSVARNHAKLKSSAPPQQEHGNAVVSKAHLAVCALKWLIMNRETNAVEGVAKGV